MALVVRDIVVLHVKFVDAIVSLKRPEFIDDVLRAAPPKLSAPEVGGRAKGAFGGAATAGIDLSNAVADRIRRLIGSDAKIFLHIVKVPGREWYFVQLR